MSYTELEHGYQGLRKAVRPTHFYVGAGDLELCDPNDTALSSPDMDDGGKVVIVGVCAMAKKSQSKPMKEILTRLQEFEYIKVTVFPEDVILQKPVEEWPVCDCLISFHSKGFPLDKAIQYAQLHNPYVINNLHMQYDIQDRRKVYAILESEGIEIPRYAVLDRDSPDPKQHELVESEDHVEVNGVTFNKPFVEKPVSAEDHNIYIYYPTSAGGGSQRLFRKIGSRSSVYSPESRVRKTGSFIYEDFMPTDGTDVKVYTVGPDYAHAEARKSPALDGKVERDREGKEIRYPVILNNAEKLISRKVCLAFKQAVCGFDLLRANGKSFVCDVNGFSFVKNSNKYYDDCAKILGNMILRELAPTLHIPWSVPFQLDDPPIVPTTFGKMMELRCVVAVIRHGDRTPKQKMKVEVRHPKFFEIFEKYDGYKHGHVKLKRPKQLQEILDIARSLLAEIQQHEADPEIEEKQGKLEQLKSVLEMYGHFSGINRKVQMKYQPKGRPRGSSSDDVDKPADPSLVLILKWGGELTPAGRIQAEELGRIFRCMYPGGQGRHLAGEYAGAQGLGLLRLHSTFRHDLKIYASDEGRVQMTAAAFAKGLLALEGELTPILVQMVKSANTNGLLDNDCDSSKFQNMCKSRLHELMQLDKDFTQEDREKINPCNSSSIADALDFVKNPVKCCRHVHELIKSLMEIVQIKKEDAKTKDAILYHGETWELMGRRWGKIEKDFYTKNKTFDISKIPDIYDCIKYDLQHNQHTLQFDQAEELYMYAKYLADIVIPQEYGLTSQEKLTIGLGICTPLLKKIRADLQRNIEETEETVNRLNPRYSHGVSSPGRHVRTRLYFTSESHIHSLITVLRHGGLMDMKKDEQWRRAMEYVSMVSELNYMSQVVIMLYEDPMKDPLSEERFHVELHFSPGVNCCVQKNLPPGPGFRPHSRNESAASKNPSGNTSATATPEESKSQSSSKIDEENEVVLEEDKADAPKVLEATSSSRELSPLPSPDEMPYYRNYKTSDPIPIRSSHTVSGHEAMHLAKRLNEELANQAKQAGSRSYSTNRSVSPEAEPRAKSYDHKSPQKGKDSPFDDTDLSTTPTNVSGTPPSFEPPRFGTPHSHPEIQPPGLGQAARQTGAREDPGSWGENVPDKREDVSDKREDVAYKRENVPESREDVKDTREDVSDNREYVFRPIGKSVLHHPDLSPISGSVDFDRSDADSVATVSSRNFARSPVELDSRPDSATNELPLTELNLALFTSEQENLQSNRMSTNERPLSDIKFKDRKAALMKQNTVDSQDSSLDVNWESDVNASDTEDKACKSKVKKTIHHRSFSDPNILDSESLTGSDKLFLLEKYNQSLLLRAEEGEETGGNEPGEGEAEEFDEGLSASLTPTTAGAQPCGGPWRAPALLLSFFSSPPAAGGRSASLPGPPPVGAAPPHVSSSTEPGRAADAGQAAAGASGGGAAVARRHRHSIAGQMSYYKMLGFGFGGPAAFKRLAAGSTSSLFSTAVISGSSSAPNLRDMIPSTASASAIEGFGGVPPIRPLETLHNALSLRQIDQFLEHMTVAPLFRTPSSTPPKYPSTPLPTPTNGSMVDTTSLPMETGQSYKLQSPNNSIGWSGPPSFVSSSGPSSPGLSENNSKESSEMSSSIVSGDGFNVDSLSRIFPTVPGLDRDLGSVGMLLDSEISGSMEFSEYYANLHRPCQGESGEVTPVSGGSEVEFNTNDATAGSTAECDVTVTEDMETSFNIGEDEFSSPIDSLCGGSKSISPKSSHIMIASFTENNQACPESTSSKSTSPIKTLALCSNVLHSPTSDHPTVKHIENVDRIQQDLGKEYKYLSKKSNVQEVNLTGSSRNISSPGSDKWGTSKEKFLDNTLVLSSYDNVDTSKGSGKDLELTPTKSNPGAVLIKERYIEPPLMTRVSRSFHGKSTTSPFLEASGAPRRASDVPLTSKNLNTQPDTLRQITNPNQQHPKQDNAEKDKASRPKFVTQKSQPCSSSLKLSNSNFRKTSLSEATKNPRFTTTLVTKDEHAASREKLRQAMANVELNNTQSGQNVKGSADQQSSSGTASMDIQNDNK